MMFPQRQSSRGFTLIEALAAIAIMLIVIPIILQGFSLASAVAGQARQTTDATMIGQSHLDEMMATQVYDGISTQDIVNGTVYTTTSIQTSYSDEVDVNQVELTVAWTGHGASHQAIKLTTLVYIPENPLATTTGGGLP